MDQHDATQSDSTQTLSTPLSKVMSRVLSSPMTEEKDNRIAAICVQEAERAAIMRIDRLAKQLGQRYSPKRVCLDQFQIYHAGQKALICQLKLLLDNVADFVPHGRGIMFYGPVGTGKDHLLASSLYAAADAGFECRWLNGQDVFGSFRDRIDTGQRDEDYFRQLCEPQVLAISDPIPPVGDPSKWDIGNLYRLLDRRYRSMKSTWVSLNALSIEDADAKLSAPVFDRLREGAEMFPCFWPSFRERKRS